MKLRELQAKRAASLDAMKAINLKADPNTGALSAEDQSDYDGHKATAGQLQTAINRETDLMVEGSYSAPAPNFSANVKVTENREADPTRGFKSMGEFFKTIHKAASARSEGQAVDQRLLIGAAAPSTFGSEVTGADGGFSIPPQFSQDIFRLSLGEDALLPLCDETTIDSNSMVFPKDETTPWGTNGIRAYWQGEAIAGTPTKPVIGTSALRLKKLMALVPMTDELLADGNALASYLPSKAGDSIRWKINEAILFGAGGGAVPQGALTSGAVITVAKDTSQATNTLSSLNLANMIARLPPGSYGKSVWLINNDVLPALFTLTLGNYPIYIATGATVGGMQSSPYGTLLGRPIMVSQHANTFSSQGDVVLADLSYYQAITKAGGIQTATSMHIYFDADLMCFRFIFRMDGQSKITTAITPAKGTNKLSPFVQLAAR